MPLSNWRSNCENNRCHSMAGLVKIGHKQLKRDSPTRDRRSTELSGRMTTPPAFPMRLAEMVQCHRQDAPLRNDDLESQSFRLNPTACRVSEPRFEWLLQSPHT